MCTILLPPGVNSIAVHKYIIYRISYHNMIWYNVIWYILYTISHYIISRHISYQKIGFTLRPLRPQRERERERPLLSMGQPKHRVWMLWWQIKSVPVWNRLPSVQPIALSVPCAILRRYLHKRISVCTHADTHATHYKTKARTCNIESILWQ